MIEAQRFLCPRCGAYLASDERESYACAYCSTVSPRAALQVPSRTPIDPGVDRLWKVVAGDFDQDGWFEVCGWDDHTLYALDPVDKTTMWKTLAGSTDDFDLFAGPGRIYVNTATELLALDAFTSQRVWSITASNIRQLHDPGHVPDGVIWVSVADEHLVALDRATGAKRASWPMNDSASLFRTLVGSNLVFNDVDGLKILHPARTEPMLQIGSGNAGELMAAVEKSMEDLAAGKLVKPISIPDSVNSAVVHRGIVYVHVSRDNQRPSLDAYRVIDGQRVARRDLDRDDVELVGAIAGHPISRKDAILRREPDGPSWTAPGEDVEIAFAKGVGNVLVVQVKHTDMGNDIWDLVGLDPTSLAQLWKLDNLGYVYGELACSPTLVVVTIQGAARRSRSVSIRRSGAMLWEAPVTRATRHGVGARAGAGTRRARYDGPGRIGSVDLPDRPANRDDAAGALGRPGSPMTSWTRGRRLAPPRRDRRRRQARDRRCTRWWPCSWWSRSRPSRS